MKRLVALGISIGVLAGLFTYVAFNITAWGSWTSPLIVWVGFAAWAMFYAAGGGTKGLMVAGGSTASGVFWGWAIAAVWIVIGPGGKQASLALLGVCVALGAFLMCVQASVSFLAFIPGAFVGAASYFGFQGPNAFGGPGFWSVLLSVVGGVVLAFVSEKGADVIERMLGLPAGDPEQAGGSHQTPNREAHAG